MVRSFSLSKSQFHLPLPSDALSELISQLITNVLERDLECGSVTYPSLNLTIEFERLYWILSSDYTFKTMDHQEYVSPFRYEFKLFKTAAVPVRASPEKSNQVLKRIRALSEADLIFSDELPSRITIKETIKQPMSFLDSCFLFFSHARMMMMKKYE